MLEISVAILSVATMAGGFVAAYRAYVEREITRDINFRHLREHVTEEIREVNDKLRRIEDELLTLIRGKNNG